MHAKATIGGQGSAKAGRISSAIFPRIATAVFAIFGASTATAREPLVDVLKAQGEEVKTFRSDVEMATLPGRDWKKLADAYRGWAEYARRENVAANLVQGLLDRAEEFERRRLSWGTPSSSTLFSLCNFARGAA